MRKVSLFLSILIISLALMGSSQAAMGGIQLKDYPNHSTLKKSLVLNSSAVLASIILLPTDPFDEREAAQIISRVDNLPFSLLSKVGEENIKLKLFIGRLTDNPTAAHLEGMIPRGYKGGTTWDDVPGIGGSKTVLVKIGFSEKGSGHSSVNLELHELAHSIDRYVYDGMRNNQKFLKIWKKEKQSLFAKQDYFLAFPEEYFAETFAMYFLGGDSRNLLKVKAPETYRFIKSLK
ncbi:anthrax toxin lethal factor-related metalloendopeptidase [Cytobacillus massiliigabonensis]|uniref:anthrax toxin lethal factor-related metalloendopeptidase n=1 Tax=Cytobacillus massiliigabonensis TaxID=1871011 RepID=UPI000C830F69|nr:toxin [Cytobacillus massiliigabonensis]